MRDVIAIFGSGVMIGVGCKSVKDAESDLTIAYNVILNIVRHLQETMSMVSSDAGGC